MFRYDTVYKVKVNDDLGSPTYWNTRLQDIDLRLNSCEQYASTISDTVDQVTDDALARVNDIINPYITALETQINGLVTQVNGLQDLVITDQNNINQQLNNLLTQGQTLVDNLANLGAISDGTF